MRLEAGYRFRGAPRFHRAFDWSDRLRLNSGVNAADPALTPQPDWRSPTAQELAILVDEADSGSAQSAERLQTFSIPTHLQSRWWELAEQMAAGGTGQPPGYQEFAHEVASFLEFKGLPLPPQCTFDVVLAPSAMATATPDRLPPVALINLGGSPASLIFVNLPPERLAQMVQPQSTEPGTTSPARQFLTAFPDYPLVRLSLEPGEGIWLPTAGGIFQHHPADGELQVWLILRRGGAT